MRVLSFTIPGDPVPAQMGTLLPGGGVATKGRALGRMRAYRDRARLFTMQAVTAHPTWDARHGRPMGVTLACHVGDARTVDVDNLAKNLLDAMKGNAFRDDAQVVRLLVTKVVDRERPRVDVTIEEATDDDDAK